MLSFESLSASSSKCSPLFCYPLRLKAYQFPSLGLQSPIRLYQQIHFIILFNWLNNPSRSPLNLFVGGQTGALWLTGEDLVHFYTHIHTQKCKKDAHCHTNSSTFHFGELKLCSRWMASITSPSSFIKRQSCRCRSDQLMACQQKQRGNFTRSVLAL